MALLSKHYVCGSDYESADVYIVEDIAALETEIRVTHDALKEEQGTRGSGRIQFTDGPTAQVWLWLQGADDSFYQRVGQTEENSFFLAKLDETII